MLAYCVYALKVASIGGLMPFLLACQCTIFNVNLLFCYVLGKYMFLSLVTLTRVTSKMCRVKAKFHYTDTDTDFFAAKRTRTDPTEFRRKKSPCPCPCSGI